MGVEVLNELTELFAEMKIDMKELAKEVRDLSDKVIGIDAKLDGLHKIQEMVYLHDKNIVETEIKLKNAQEKISDIENTLTWIWRSVGGVLIVSLLSLILTKVV